MTCLLYFHPFVQKSSNLILTDVRHRHKLNNCKDHHGCYRNKGKYYIFKPIGIETCGSWGPQARSLIYKIGKKIIAVSAENKSCAYLIQRISLAIQIGNASSVFGTLPSTLNLEKVFYLM